MPVLPEPQRLSLHDAVNYVAEMCKCETERAGRAVHAALREGALFASANVLVKDQSAGPPRDVDTGIGSVPSALWAEIPSPEFLRRVVPPRGNPMFKGQPRTPVYSDPTIATADIDAWLDRNHDSREVLDGVPGKENELLRRCVKPKGEDDLTPQQILIEIAGYERRITGILSRFRDYKISDPDVDIFSELIIEIADLLTDALGPNFYSTNIMKLYNYGVQNDAGRPSFKSVQEILGVIRAAHRRIERNLKLIEKNKSKDYTLQRWLIPLSQVNQNLGLAGQIRN